jgi:hypothetical protein
LRPSFAGFAAQGVPAERQIVARLARRGDPSEIVVRIADVRLGARQVLDRDAVEIVVGERDAGPVAQPPRSGVAVGVVAQQLLVVGRAARIRALGRERIADLRRPVEAPLGRRIGRADAMSYFLARIGVGERRVLRDPGRLLSFPALKRKRRPKHSGAALHKDA